MPDAELELPPPTEPGPGCEQGPWERPPPQGWAAELEAPERLELTRTTEPAGPQGPLEPEVLTPQGWTPPEPTGWKAMAGGTPDGKPLAAMRLGTMGLPEKYLPSETGGPAARAGAAGPPRTGPSLVK